ncbi:hypothetical protein PZB75_00340 [Streptomyces sp. AM 4-1-1]|uniref:hypothetical protein n=1 Tax=Streptomyces sp. AM 4-1-1 TaxID=3028710 RepID=UPI0023B99E7C|nr:hypothetical protein [Streptomyces sp. AM 4-1-1]WEH31965.1 hypothetical protein PZB75_00340 [Streptomyces sp. AM 4-1-1]
MSSKFGDIQIGYYNCLPPETTINLPYRMSNIASMVAIGMPHVEWGKEDDGTKWLMCAFDRDTKTSDVGDWRAAQSILSGRSPFRNLFGQPTSGDVKKVHANWSEWPYQLPQKEIDRYTRVCGEKSQPYALYDHCASKELPAAFAGKLVGYAPLIAQKIPFSGMTKKYVSEVSVKVTDTSAHRSELGLSGEAGIAVPNIPVKLDSKLMWTKSVTEETEVNKSHIEQTEIEAKENEFVRLDLRACAGLYSGYIFYQVQPATLLEPTSVQLGAYPAIMPIHSPGCPASVAEHRMKASTTLFSEDERALMDMYSQAEAEYQSAWRAATHTGKSAPDTTDSRLLELDKRLGTLRAAAVASRLVSW